MKNERGITLESLVITIIILLILSSIAIYSGLNTVKYVKFNKAKSEIQLMQSHVNSWYQEYLNGNNNVLYYGVPTDDSSCDSISLSRTVNATGINASDYRYLSEKYIKNNLGMDSSFEFLVNVKQRNVILFNGIVYQDNIYYTTEDFDIYNVKDNSNVYSLDFKLNQGNKNEIVIRDLIFREYNGRIVNISKFDVEYKRSDEADNMWRNVTNKLTKFEENGETKYKFEVPEIKDKFEETTYNVRVSLNNKEIEYTSNVVVESKEYIKDGLMLHLDGINNTGSGHSDSIAVWKDLSGNGNDGNLNNFNNTAESGWGEDCISFDGNDDWVNCGAINSNYATWEVVFSQTQPTQGYIMCSHEGGGGGIMGKPVYGSFFINGQYQNISTNLTPVNLKRYTITLTYDGTSEKIYVNGVKKNTLNVAGSITYPTNNGPVVLGAQPDGGIGINGWFTGNIYNARIYNRALTDEEIAHNYKVDQERFNIEQE